MNKLSTNGYESLVGNKKSKIYHYRIYCDGSCQINEIQKSNRQYFCTTESARLAGYKPCKNCLDNKKKRYYISRNLEEIWPMAVKVVKAARAIKADMGKSVVVRGF